MDEHITSDEDMFPAPLPIDLPKDPKKLRARLRSYERSLRKEKEEYGMIGDGYGKRFLIGPMYMLLGDLDGALLHFEWFEDEFDFNGDCFQLMTWALALYRSGDEDKAKHLLKLTMLSNLYQIPKLIGDEIHHHDIYHGSNTELPDWLNCVPQELYGLWTEAEIDWARAVWMSNEFKSVREEYIEHSSLLLDLPVSAERNEIINRMYELSYR